MNQFTLAFLILLSGAACSSIPTPPRSEKLISSNSALLSDPVRESSVDIQYILGRDHYRLVLSLKGKAVSANTSIDKHILAQGLIDSRLYADFLTKATHFVDHCPREAIPPPLVCRTPFRVTVKIGDGIQTARGCRSNDGGSLSKLVHDGEFLLYSKI